MGKEEEYKDAEAEREQILAERADGRHLTVVSLERYFAVHQICGQVTSVVLSLEFFQF